MSNKNIAGVGLCIPVTAGFLYFICFPCT